MAVTSTPPPSPPRQHLSFLLLQRDKHPEPAHGLDKHKGEKYAVLEGITAPAGGGVPRVIGGTMSGGVLETGRG